jgi:beta-aspartyl-peptidase (threonine type)
MSGWSLIVHGGAKAIAPGKADANRRGLAAAVEAGSAVLQAGGSALDAAEQAIRAMEDAPVFNAGYGSVLNADGEVEMDAALMEGSQLGVGAVGAIRGVRHPVSVARAVLGATPVLLVAEGARRFAQEQGLELCDPAEMIAPGVASSGGGLDTVGCVARDQHGCVAAGTSTGGLAGKRPGRVGDSPLPGCGLYAMDAVGGVSVSGDGDKIARVLLAARVMQALRGGEARSAAAATALQAMDWVGGEAGVILLDARGRLGCAHNSANFAMGGASSERPQPAAWLHQDELYEAVGHD